MTWAWGWGQHGQLGLGHWDDELSPQPLHSLAEVEVRKLCLGGRHSLALCGDGRVYTWGRDEDGQLGLGAQGARCVPTAVDPLTTKSSSLLAASCGWAHTACLLRAHLRTSSEMSPPDGGSPVLWAQTRRSGKGPSRSKTRPTLIVM